MKTPIPEPVASFIQTVNRHDRAGFLAALVDDAVVDDWGRTFTGADEIAAWSNKEFIGSEGVLTVEQVTTVGEHQVTVVGDWRSNHANGRSTFTFDIVDQLISLMTIREG